MGELCIVAVCLSDVPILESQGTLGMPICMYGVRLGVAYNLAAI